MFVRFSYETIKRPANEQMKAWYYLSRRSGIGSIVLIQEGVASLHRILVFPIAIGMAGAMVADCKLLAVLWSGNDNEHYQL